MWPTRPVLGHTWSICGPWSVACTFVMSPCPAAAVSSGWDFRLVCLANHNSILQSPVLKLLWSLEWSLPGTINHHLLRALIDRGHTYWAQCSHWHGSVTCLFFFFWSLLLHNVLFKVQENQLRTRLTYLVSQRGMEVRAQTLEPHGLIGFCIFWFCHLSVSFLSCKMGKFKAYLVELWALNGFVCGNDLEETVPGLACVSLLLLALWPSTVPNM